MLVEIRFPYGIETDFWSDEVGVGLGQMYEATGESVERSSLDYTHSSSPRCIWVDDKGLHMARRHMLDRYKDLSRMRLNGDKYAEEYGDPRTVKDLMSFEDMQDQVMWVRVNGETIWQNPASKTDQKDKQPELQMRDIPSRTSMAAQAQAAQMKRTYSKQM